MTLHKRQLPGHRLVVARQKNDNSIFDTPDGDGPGGGNGNSNGPGGSGNGNGGSSSPGTTSQAPATSPPSKPPTPPTTTLPTTTKSRQPPPTTTTTQPDPVTTQPLATENTSSSSTPTTSSIPSTTSTLSTSKTSVAPVTITGAPVIKTTTTPGYDLPSFTASATPSATSSSAPSSGTGTGTIIGGVVGGLAAIAIIGIIASFILRRLRKRREDDEFNSDEFVRPPNLNEPDFQRSSTFDASPPNMAQLGRNEIISTYSNSGMAGHGAFAYGPGAPNNAGSSNGGLQERQNYAYGQGYDGDDGASDHAHGAYSSEPLAQAAYNPEAYGSYAYSTEGNNAVSPGVYMNYQQQQQHGGHYDAHGQGGEFAPLSSPYDNAPAGGPASSPPALVAGAPAVAAGRGANTRSVYEDDDAYGGI